MSTNWIPIPSPGVTFRTIPRLRISPSGTESKTVMAVPRATGVGVAMNKPPTFRSRTRETSCRAPSCQATQTPIGVGILWNRRSAFDIFPGHENQRKQRAHNLTSPVLTHPFENFLLSNSLQIVSPTCWRSGQADDALCARRDWMNGRGISRVSKSITANFDHASTVSSLRPCRERPRKVEFLSGCKGAAP
jgi:hypothetical protein